VYYLDDESIVVKGGYSTVFLCMGEENDNQRNQKTLQIWRAEREFWDYYGVGIISVCSSMRQSPVPVQVRLVHAPSDQ